MWYYYLSLLLFAVSALISLSVKSSFKKYSSHYTQYSGAYASERILREAGIDNVRITAIAGNLTDNYNPANKTLNLSENVYGSNSVSAIAVAAHECGHAIQEAEGYALLNIRKTLVPVANFTSSASYVLILLGLAMETMQLVSIGAILFAVIVLFNLVTLPIEIDASNRALRIIKNLNLVESDQMSGCHVVLRLAGMTYFISLMSSLLTLMRYISIANRGSRRRR